MQSKIITLDEGEGHVEFEQDDWIACPNKFGIMHHRPTHTDYFVGMPARCHKDPNRAISMFEIEAQLVKVPSGSPWPSLKEQTELSRAAIAVFLIETGLWKPEVIHVDRPEDKIRRHAANKLIN